MRTVAVVCLNPVLYLFAACAPDSEPQDELPPFPGFDIYLAERTDADGRAEFAFAGAAIERPGYDNQPHFLPAGRAMYYSSQRDDRQTDIFLYDGESGRDEQVTATASSEFSPTITPDGAHLSSVLIEEDGATQRLWQYSLAADGDRKVLLPDVFGVGYHAWLNEHTVALFIVGEPPTLHIADVRTGGIVQIAEHIGRSFHRVPGRNTLSFVDKSGDERWMINEYDLDSGSFANLFQTLAGSEDYVWLDGQTILMARGKQLFSRVISESGWQLAGDYSATLPGNITRLALNGNGRLLAMVVAEEPAE